MSSSELLRGTRSRWLVTGAAGFIGSHLAEALVHSGQEVVVVDNFSTGRRANLEAAHRRREPGQYFEFIEGDIGDAETARRAVQGVDYVLHQAALGSVPRSLLFPMHTFDSNVRGFMRVLTASKDAGVKTFVYASSSSVYGDHPDLPKQEERVGKLLSPYAATKLANEVFADVFARCYGMRTIGLRYFNVFGPRQDQEGPYAAVIPRWCAAMLRGEPVYIHGDGESSRDFCYVDNVVQANIRAALSKHTEPLGTVLNIAVGEQTTLLELFGMLRNLLAKRRPELSTLEPTHLPFRAGDVRHSLASIDAARRLIGYEPTHRLERGLELAMDWYAAAA